MAKSKTRMHLVRNDTELEDEPGRHRDLSWYMSHCSKSSHVSRKYLDDLSLRMEYLDRVCMRLNTLKKIADVAHRPA